MALTQMQLIQSLGEALAWLEREIHWEVPPTELRHLCGRIGELYACVVTNGQMALKVNERGYDVRSATQERISVKTTAMLGNSGHISFNSNTLESVDRVMILRINTNEMQVETLLDAPIADARKMMSQNNDGNLSIALSKLRQKSITPGTDVTVRSALFDGYAIVEHESGSIEVWYYGEPQTPAKPVLRSLASKLGVSFVNTRGNPYNTRQLGSLVIEAALARQGQTPT